VWYLPEDEKVVRRAKGGLHESAYRGRTPDTGGVENMVREKWFAVAEVL
jgi:hypothetical protein